jgi:hypothetical protein
MSPSKNIASATLLTDHVPPPIRRPKPCSSHHPRMVDSDLPAMEAASFLFWLRFELNLLNRFAFAATRFLYRRTILSPEAPATSRRFKRSIYLFTDHSFGFRSGAVATPHQFHHPQRYNAICLGCQHHQRSEHPRIGPANRLVTENLGASF